MSPVHTASPQMHLVRLLIGRRITFDPATESPGTIHIERGGVLADRLCGNPVRHIERPDPAAAVVDALGHTRPVNRGLLHYCLALAGAESHCQDNRTLPIDTARVDSPTSPARLGSQITAAAWNALARVAADPQDADATSFLRRIVANRSPDGPFLTAARSDNPETFWYHDLILLHAIDAYADLTGDPAACSAVARAAAYHQDQTQTDHATAEPWGLPAFLKTPETIPTADALLHAAQTNQPNGPGGVTLLLLADTLYRSRLGGPAR